MMRYLLYTCLIASVHIAVPAIAQQAISPAATAFHQKAISTMNRQHVAWIQQTAQSLKSTPIDESAYRVLAQKHAAQFGITNESDIMALVFFVMMEQAKSNEQELKDLMNQMEENRKNKEKLRETSRALKEMKSRQANITKQMLDSIRITTNKNALRNTRVVQQKNVQLSSGVRRNQTIVKATPEQVQQLEDELKSKLDSLNDMGELEQLRLQQYMDRRSKALETLSNILKKISDTQDNIIGNLK
ncbi:MAG: hypothetical protein ACOYKE_10180 [Ferruginibacter sp.]